MAVAEEAPLTSVVKVLERGGDAENMVCDTKCNQGAHSLDKNGVLIFMVT